MPETSVEIKGLDKLRAAFKRFPGMVTKHMSQAGSDASDEILRTKGLRSYPGQTGANKPPTPFYIRGRGTQYKSFNAGNSENYKAQWTTKTVGYKTTIGNPVSYAPHLAGDKQARAMKRIGWVKLKDATQTKMKQIQRIYQRWVNEALRKAGL